MSATVLELTPRPDVDRALLKLEQASGLPIFSGGTYDDHVEAWRLADAVAQGQQWQLAAIADSLPRFVGGSPRQQAGRQQTAIQRFCRDVGIDRMTFYRLSRTYRTFAGTGNTGVTSLISKLSFKHFRVAAQLAEDPAAAVIEASEKGWSANQLERQLGVRPDPIPFSLPDAMAKLQETNSKVIASWPEWAQQQAAEILQTIFAGVIDDLAAPIHARLTKPELHALHWIRAELEHLPYTKRTFNEAPVGRGGSPEVVAGAAGAPIYQEIIGTMFRATRQQVLKAVDNLLAGKVTPVGMRVAEVAREVAQGRLTKLMKLPPSAGGDLRGTQFERYFDVGGTLFEGHYEWRGTSFGEATVPDSAPASCDDLPHCLRELTASDYDDPIAIREEEAMAFQ